jgi:hypothetical protein
LGDIPSSDLPSLDHPSSDLPSSDLPSIDLPSLNPASDATNFSWPSGSSLNPPHVSPPPSPENTVTEYTVTAELIVAGDVSDLSAADIQAMKEAFASIIPGASASEVTISLQSASVRVVIEFKSTSLDIITVAKASLTRELSSASSATAVLAASGIVVTSMPLIRPVERRTVVASPPSTSLPPLQATETQGQSTTSESNSFMMWLPAVVLAVTSVLACLMCCSYVWCLLRRAGWQSGSKKDGANKQAARGRLSLSRGALSVSKSVDALHPISSIKRDNRHENATLEAKEKEWEYNYGESGPKIIHHSLWRPDEQTKK